MARRFISQLGEHETIDQIFLASDKQLRANRNGNLYLQLRLADRTGAVTAMMWNANDQVYASFENGDFLRVQGSTQFYNGTLQIIVSRLERGLVGDVDQSDFVTLGANQIERLVGRLSDLLRRQRNYHLRNLAECFLMDESFMAKFTAAPGGVKLHHAYRGGLLEHVVSLMEVASAVAPVYPGLDPDLLLMGAFLHDVGKTEELTYERDLGYSDEGQLLGHLVLGVGILDAKVRETEKLGGEPFPAELSMRLKHMIVSHHGDYQFGSPKLPMTAEAVALHYLDNLDAKLHAVQQVILSDVNADSSWTPYQAMLSRKIYKGEGTTEAREPVSV